MFVTNSFPSIAKKETKRCQLSDSDLFSGHVNFSTEDGALYKGIKVMTQLDFNDMGLSGGEPIEMHVLFDSMSTIVRLINQDLILKPNHFRKDVRLFLFFHNFRAPAWRMIRTKRIKGVLLTTNQTLSSISV